MKKIFRMFFMAVMAVCLSITGAQAAEAASVALLPLVNHTENETAGQVFFREALDILKMKPGFVLMDNEKISKAAAANTVSGVLPGETALKHIADEGGVEIVICCELDKMAKKVIPSSQERTMVMQLSGKMTAYNAITGKYYSHKFSNRNKAPEALTSRWDWVSEQWARQARVELKKALEAK